MERAENKKNLLYNLNEKAFNDNKEIVESLLNNKLNDSSKVYLNKSYPLYIDFFKHKNLNNYNPNYHEEFSTLRNKINSELQEKTFAELNELEKNILLIQYKEFISCLLKHKQENISDMEREYNQMQNNAKILQDKIDKKAQNDYELEMKVKLMEQKKKEQKDELTKKLSSVKDNQDELIKKMKKSQEIIDNYENSISGENNNSIFDILLGLKEENKRLNELCDEQELEITSLDQKKKDLKKDIALIEQTPNKMQKF